MNLSRPRSAIVAGCLTVPLALLIGTRCHADYITTSAAACQLYGAPGGGSGPVQHPEDFLVLPTSVGNRSGDRDVDVACPVIPAPAIGATVSYFVDGSLHGSGRTMVCVMGTTSFTGTFLAARVFGTTLSPFDQFVSFTSAEAPPWAYVGLHCDMPPNSSLYGVTAIKPASAASAAVDSRPDAGSRAAGLLAFEAHVASIAAGFDRQDRDQRWSTDASALLKSIFDQPHMRALKLTSADCRTTTCRVEIDHDGTPESSALLGRIGLQMAGTISSVVAEERPASAERSRTVLYMSREAKN
jgi:hypothetical protein